MFDTNIAETLQGLSVWALPVLLAITLHEAAHGFAAKKFGDNTAWMLGRVTLNPLKHIDPIGTIAMPLLLLFSGLPMIGYAKPVPVNFMQLKPRRMASALVALAGPAANLVLIILSVVLLHLAVFLPESIAEFSVLVLIASIKINAILMVFNLLPLPPLDGSRVIGSFLPPSLEYYWSKLDSYGMIVVILLAVTGLLFNVISPLMNLVMQGVIPFLPA